ncbi:DNA-3-methyladenine glycosylase I [Terrarubrum flagellatum]|uniref:DNA-3-methyladenine glycosylase I n=1 Tax=Terrirubrum flagellatum TaxID=2895980 RepID=UPI003144E36F
MPPPREDLITHEDGKARCGWPGVDPFYVRYHDEEWGVPERDSRALFEKLLLDGFQAGLSWITILRKRDNFRKAFVGFEPEKIVRFTPKKIESLMQNEGIVRNRMKIEGSIPSAKAYLKIEEREGFSNYLWKYFDGRAQQNSYTKLKQVPAETPLSQRISKDLKKEGFTFCGPTIVYAFMQATGFYNDHLVGCFRHDEVAKLAER